MGELTELQPVSPNGFILEMAMMLAMMISYR